MKSLKIQNLWCFPFISWWKIRGLKFKVKVSLWDDNTRTGIGKPVAKGLNENTGRYFYVPRWLVLFRAMLGSTVVTCSCTVSGGFRTHFQLFLRARFARILRSILVLLSVVFSLSLLKARFEELNMDFFVLQNGVVCTVDASIAWICRVFLHLKFRHYFISHCIRQACGLVSVLHEKSSSHV